MHIKTRIEPATILRARGLGSSPAARVRLCATVARLCDPYVPMRQGTLKNTRAIDPEGRRITYGQPYAHYQYKGRVMGGRAPKGYTGTSINYHGAPMRGPLWDRRMMADRKRDVEAELAQFVGGKPK